MKKKFYLMMAVVMMLSVVLASGAFADSDYAYEELNGYDCRGFATCYNTSATSSTKYYGPIGSVVVRLRLFYWDYEDLEEKSKYESKSANSSYVSKTIQLSNASSRYSNSTFEVHSSGDIVWGLLNLHP